MTFPGPSRFQSPPKTPGKSPFTRHKAVPPLLILLITAALYLPVLQFDFINLDDDDYILNDPVIQEITTQSLKSIFLEPYAQVWYPIARLSAAVDIAIFGHEAGGHHLMNVLLHFLNAAMLFLVLQSLGQQLPGKKHAHDYSPALLVSLLFAVHPQHVEAVSWVVQRKELLASLFSLLALNLFLKKRFFSTSFFLILAMLSKPTAVVMPFMLIVLKILLEDPRTWSFAVAFRAIRLNALSIGAAAGVSIVVLINTGTGTWLNQSFPLQARAGLYANNVLDGISGFITLLARPIYQPIPDYILDSSWLGGVSVLVLALLLATSIALLLSRELWLRLAAFGFLFYCAALVTTGGLILFGNYAFGDRYLYLSSVGLYLTTYALIANLWSRYRPGLRRRLVGAVAVIYIACAFLASYKAIPNWSDSESLWTHSIERYPDTVFAHHQLGLYYFYRHDYEPALRHFAASVDSPSERFRVAPRVASVLYMVEILCASGRVGAVTGLVELVPRLTGSLSPIDGLMASLKHSGYDTCYSLISDWRDARARKD